MTEGRKVPIDELRETARRRTREALAARSNSYSGDGDVEVFDTPRLDQHDGGAMR